MTTAIYDIHHTKLINTLAQHLKQTGKIELPQNHEFIKTCHGKENSPLDSDWFYTRLASTFRRIVAYGVKYQRPMTVKRLASIYGCAKDRGARPSKHVPATKSLIRKVLRNLEALGWIETREKGRVVTEEGKRMVESIIKEIE